MPDTPPSVSSPVSVAYPTPTGYTITTPYDPPPPAAPSVPPAAPPPPPEETESPIPVEYKFPTPILVAYDDSVSNVASRTEAAWYIKVLVFVIVFCGVFGGWYANNIGLIHVPLPFTP